MKRKFRIRQEYMGLSISVKTLSGGTLTMSTKEVSEEDLALYFRIEEFTPYIEEIWETPSQGVNSEECPHCGDASCVCAPEVAKPARKKSKKNNG